MNPKNDFAVRKSARQARSLETVEAILTAATRVLVREGFQAANTNRIAAIAGVSVGSLYQYFPNKEVIVATLIERHNQVITELIESKLAALKDEPVETVIVALVEATVAVHTVNPELHKVFAEQIPRVGQFERAMNVENRIAEILCDYFEVKRSELRPSNLKLAAFIVVQSVESIIHAATMNHKEAMRTAELSDEIAKLLLSYLIRKPATIKRSRRTAEMTRGKIVDGMD